jgi:hypothetical protein
MTGCIFASPMMRVGMGRWSLAAMPIAGIVVALI